MKTIGYNPSLSTDNGLVNVDYPLKYESGGVKCLGYCDGLVWFVYERRLGTGHVCIWNPATNEYKELPVAPTESLNVNGMRRFEYGFGMRRFEYGLVMLTRLKISKWIVERTTGALSVIISFDLAQVIIQEIGLPNLTDKMYGRSLCVLDGSLCVLGNDDEVWEFKNYETEDSWTKLFRIRPEHIFGFKAYLTPLNKLGNGNILLGLHTVNASFHLIMYGPKQETFNIKFYEEVGCHHFYTSIYVESLVSLNSGAYISAKTVKESHEKREQWVQCIQIQDVNENDYFSGGDDADDASDSDEQE
ncbi:F-box protein CPR1-like [Papaver somniferum]|uniref:F-box protein CPR1-like n=1 Tax=Papaver somniferum TaxID=3469 RepID=UPI000E700DEE|nr:F-box protein CPR1-like [Papaver somniferum]